MYRGWMVAAVIGVICIAARADAPATAPAGSSANVELQLAALNALNDLDLDTGQLKAIRTMLKSQSAPPATEPGEAGSAAYQASLKSLCDAVIDDDAQKAADAEQKVDQLRTDEHLTVVTTVPLTDFARTHASDLLKLLRSNQLGGYLAAHGDEVPDATGTILDAMDESRGKSDADYAPIRSEAVNQVSVLMCGVATGPDADKVQKDVGELLDHAHGMTDAQYKSGYRKLEKQTHAIVGELNAFTALQNWMQREMADLLANPELGAMIDARLAHPQS